MMRIVECCLGVVVIMLALIGCGGEPVIETVIVQISATPPPPTATATATPTRDPRAPNPPPTYIATHILPTIDPTIGPSTLRESLLQTLASEPWTVIAECALRADSWSECVKIENIKTVWFYETGVFQEAFIDEIDAVLYRDDSKRPERAAIFALSNETEDQAGVVLIVSDRDSWEGLYNFIFCMTRVDGEWIEDVPEVCFVE